MIVFFPILSPMKSLWKNPFVYPNLVNLRRYTHFDAVSWLKKEGVSPKTSVSSFLSKFDRLDPQNQKLVHSTVSIPHLHHNISLHLHLRNNDLVNSFILIKSHLSPHSPLVLNPQLVESFIFQSLQNDHISAAVSVIHLLRLKNPESFTFSTQLWSLLASKAIEYCNHAAATLVLHEVIDPYQNHSNDSPPVPYFPFLLMPEILPLLAVVFVRHKNPQAIESIKAYFKQFFSYLGHRHVYKAITIAHIEALAHSGRFKDSLVPYKLLAWLHRGHGVVKNVLSTEHNLRYAVNVNLKNREKMISEMDNYLPAYNNLTVPGKRYNALFDGVLNIADVPHFHSCVVKTVEAFIAADSNCTEKLLLFLISTDHSLLKHVIAALCEKDLVFDAWALINRAPRAFPRIRLHLLFRGDELFVSMFCALERSFRRDDGNFDENVAILAKCRHFVTHSSKDGWSYNSRLACLMAMLESGGVFKHDIEFFIDEWRRSNPQNRHFVISLTETHYQKLKDYQIDKDILGKIVSTRYLQPSSINS